MKELDCLQTLEPHERDFLTESNIFFDSKHEIFESPDLRKPILKNNFRIFAVRRSRLQEFRLEEAEGESV